MKKTILSIFLFFISLISLALAADRISIVDGDGIAASLEYGTGVSNSYLDNVGRNPDIRIRVYTSDHAEDLEGMYVCLLYKVGESYKIVNFGTTEPDTDCEPLGKEQFYNPSKNFSDTMIGSTGLDSTKAFYPAILWGVVSKDKTIDKTDTYILLNPAADGWLIGEDGGPPCIGGAGAWMLSPAGCNIEPNADQEYDSYDVTVYQLPEQSKVRIWVNSSYYPVSEISVQEIPIDIDYIVVGITDENGDVLDSGVTSLYDITNGPDLDDSDDFLDLDFGPYSGKLNIVVNGIRTDALDVTSFTPEAPSRSEGSLSDEGGGEDILLPKEIEEVDSRYIWIFPINYTKSLVEIKVYTEKPLLTADLYAEVIELGLEDTYEAYDIKSTFDRENTAAVFIKFRVSEAWLLENGMYKKDVYLSYEDDGWKSIKGTLIGDDDEYFYYVVRMDELRRFSIGGKKGDIKEISEEEKAELLRLYLKVEGSEYLLWILLILVMILALILFVRQRRKHRK